LGSQADYKLLWGTHFLVDGTPQPFSRLRERVASLGETGEGRSEARIQLKLFPMKKLEPNERLKHGVIVLLKKEDYEDLKRFSELQNASHAAWTRKFVIKALDRARKLEKIEREAAAAREIAAAREAKPKSKPKSKPKLKSKS